MQELLSLWKLWEQENPLPHGKAKWATVFSQLRTIRPWGVEETLRETGMIDLWQDILNPLNPSQPVTFQIELFYRKSQEKRKNNEDAIKSLLASLGGRTLGDFLDMNMIGFHAVKAELPAYRIQELLERVNNANESIGIDLFIFQGVMYFRPTGQSLAVSEEGEGESGEFSAGQSELPPVAAMLDGAPLLLHDALKDRLQFEDLFQLEQHYQPGERRHGTSMASLILHGDLNAGGEPSKRKLYCIPIMQPDPKSLNRDEHMPDDVFFEDRIHRAVRRMFEGDSSVPPQAPGVKVINLSFGDPFRPFIHTPSPWARLLDWLSWKYRVLFCVSAGNCLDNIDTKTHHTGFAALSDADKSKITIQSIASGLSSRRLIAPAESLNAITIGAMHEDDSGLAAPDDRRIDLLPVKDIFSPAMRLGHGFRRSIKPEVLFPGGRQYYQTPISANGSSYRLDNSKAKPGQMVAYDSRTSGSRSHRLHTRGTSNAAALGTRSAWMIYDMLDELRKTGGTDIPENLVAVVIKALMVHGARQPEGTKQLLAEALKNPSNSRQFKEVITRYLGYGAANIDRILACTDQRATVIGFGEIKDNEIHEFEFPLPQGLSEQRLWRCLIITLAWFSPINPDHRNLREAKLELAPGGAKWDTIPLKLHREDGDNHQVLRGTIQHEILEGKDQIALFQEGDMLKVHVICKKDATTHLDQIIPYGLAVTLEVKEDVNIPVYIQIRNRLKAKVGVRT